MASNKIFTGRSGTTNNTEEPIITQIMLMAMTFACRGMARSSRQSRMNGPKIRFDSSQLYRRRELAA